MWWKVVPLLEERGVTCQAVDLPTCRAEDTSVDLHDDARHVRSVLDPISGPVVLVGNSYGGVVITEAAVDSANVKRLVYLAAAMPAENEALLPLMSEMSTPDFGGAVQILEDGRMHLDMDVELRCAFQQADPDDHDVVRNRTSYAMSFGTDFEVALARAAWRDIPSTYIVCEQDLSIRPDVQRKWARERATDVVELPFDHCPQVSHPEQIADLLARIAREATAGVIA
jgi:pimeloyl-ACP methyl ester carboxylesterase